MTVTSESSGCGWDGWLRSRLKVVGKSDALIYTYILKFYDTEGGRKSYSRNRCLPFEIPLSSGWKLIFHYPFVFGVLMSRSAFKSWLSETIHQCIQGCPLNMSDTYLFSSICKEKWIYKFISLQLVRYYEWKLVMVAPKHQTVSVAIIIVPYRKHPS